MTPLETYLQANEERFLEELKVWLRIPSISTLPEHAGDVRRAGEFAVRQLREIGFAQVQLLETQGHPLVYGEWLKEEGQPTVLVYGHYDVQPVDPLELWETPPFEPTVRAGNLYARGASDDKGQMMLVLKALEALERVHGKLPVNVRVLLEGEEEAGGVSIAHYVRTSPERLACDATLLCDFSMPSPEVPAVVYGSRGIVYVEVEVRGARRDLHLGDFGGVAPNPLQALALIIAGLKDAEGHITIPGLFDHVCPPTEAERIYWSSDPQGIEHLLKAEMGVKQLSGENEYSASERISVRPTLEVHGISGGFVGEGVKTVIPAGGKAKISLRLPPNLTSSEAFTLLEHRVKELAPRDVEVMVHRLQSGEAVLLERESTPMRAAIAALKETYGREPLLVREGGSTPIAALFSEVLHVPMVLTGFSLPDDNLHAPNEKYALSQFSMGLRAIASLFQKLGEMSG